MIQQFIAVVSQGPFTGVPSPVQYLTAPDPPTFDDSITITEADLGTPGVLGSNDISGKTQVILSGVFAAGLQVNSMPGSLGNPLIIKGEDVNAIVGDAALDNHAIFFLPSPNVTNYLELWNVTLRAGGSGHSALVWSATTNGSIIRTCSIKVDNVTYAAMLAQDQSTARTYKGELHAFWIADGKTIATGEPYYQGYVTITSASECKKFVLIQNRIINFMRESFQVKKVDKFYIANNTYYNVGSTVSPTGQDHLFQVEASIGIVRNNVFDTGRRAWNIFTHDLLVENNVIKFNNQFGYIGDALDQFPGDPRLNGNSQNWRGNIIIWDGSVTLDYITEIAERTANVNFQDNIFVKLGGNITSLYYDHRNPGYTNTITGTLTTNGNTLVSTIGELIYLSMDVDNVDFMKLATGAYFSLEIGALTPTSIRQVVDCYELVSSQVPLNTIWADVSLPATADFILSDRSTVSLPVSWSQGSYDGTTPGDYTVYGTPTLPDGVYNDVMDVAAEQVVTVNTAPTVKINFGSATATYVSSGNWNNVFGANPSGVQTIKGDNSGDTLASLRDTDGNLTGWGINVDLLVSGNNTGENPSGAGPYPDTAQVDLWYSPSGTRGFYISGLDPTHTYKFDLLCTAASYLSGAQIMDLNVLGTSRTGIDIKGNTTTIQSFTGSPNGSGQGFVRLIKNTNQASLSVLQITDLG